jgi:Zn-dependent protease with chaperone function
MPEAPSLKKPRWWAVRDGHGMQIRWIGLVLVIDQGLLGSKHFPALLAHELARCNSFDLFTRTLFTIFPPLRWSILTLVGLPNASGKILLYPLWMKYWRDRVYAADEYAARLGQRHQLIRALDELKWAFEGSTATKGGRWLRETPYMESRVDRLMRYQLPSARPALGR